MSFSDLFLRYFPVPHFLDMPHAGVEITPHFVRFLELAKKDGKLGVRKYGVQPIPQASVQGGAMQMPAEDFFQSPEVEEALRKVARTHKLDLVEVSVPEGRSYLYTTEIPFGDDASIRSNIEFHLEENVPISLADAVFDYYIYRRNEATKTLFLTVTVLPRSVVEGYIDLFKRAGLTPVSFLVENQAVSKAVIRRGDEKAYLLVHVGEKKTVLSIVSQEAVQFTSTVPIGSIDFTQAIMKTFNVNEEEAEKIKKEKGFLKSKENENLFMSLINTASALRDEISRIFAYWQSYRVKTNQEATIPEIQTVLITGKDALIRGFRDYIAVSLKVDVKVANVWSNVMDFEKEIPPLEFMESLDYGTVIGLALPKKIAL